jgi:RNA polymerase sigma-70 factor (ECF subfamily)
VSSSNAAGLSALLLRFGRSSIEEAVAETSSQDATRVEDQHLLLRVQAGDREALGILFDRYARLVLAVGQRIIRDAGEAEDLVHDVFLFLLNKSVLFDPAKGSARAWLAKITYYRALDRRKYLVKRCFYDGRRNGNSHDRASASGAASPELFYWQSYLQRAFDDLSEEQRITLELHFFEGFTINEISERIGKEPGNVRHYYYRGLERLRTLMTRPEVQRQEQAQR